MSIQAVIILKCSRPVLPLLLLSIAYDRKATVHVKISILAYFPTVRL